MSLRFATLVILLTSMTVPAMAGQTTAQGTAPRTPAPSGVIRGIVTAADTGQPIRGADIRIQAATFSAFESRWTRTDEQGRFEVKELRTGRYNLTASKVGYVTLAYGQRRPAEQGRPVEFSESTPVEKIDFALPRGSVIVARITDRFGDPVRGVSVRAYQYRFVAGERRLQQASQGSNVSDDRGEQRLFGLAPGEYYLAASPGFPPSVRGDAETYYPGTVRVEEARAVKLGIGDEAHVTFEVATAKPARLSGVIIGSTGMPLSNAMASLQVTFLGSGSARRLTVLPDGSFNEDNLPPGDYWVEVRSPEYAMHGVRVFGDDITNLVVNTKKAGAVRARLTFDAPQPPAESMTLRAAFVGRSCGLLGLAGSCGGGSIGLVQPVMPDDWTFSAQLTGVGVLRLQRPSTWFLKAVLLEGKDVTDTPLEFATAFDGKPVEIVLTQRQGAVSGTVTDDRGQLAPDSVVVLFPDDDAQWTPFSRFIATGRPDQQGRFSLAGLPPGRYLITALDYLEPGEERNPETLARLRAGATSFSLSDSETRTLSLRIVP